MAGLVVAVESAKEVGFQFPHYFLLFGLLGDASCVCFFLWLIRRWKKESS